MRAPRFASALVPALLLAAASASAAVALPGLGADLRVLTDGNGVPHIFAQDDVDLARAAGYVQARDRFFQMDVGESGIDFFDTPAGLSSAEDRRDAILLAAVRSALETLASDEFAPAFGDSTWQGAYTWGKLHRITFDHPFVPAFSIPPAGGFDDLSTELTGLSRDGGYEVVNASSFSARADGLDEFKFGSGPARRYVGVAGQSWGPVAGNLYWPHV